MPQPPNPPQRRAAATRAATAAVAFGVYADLAYNTYSATNSSPQTTELFAGERLDALWKYVTLGHVQAIAIGLFGSFLDKSLWPLVGTVSVGAIMHGMYAHAVKAGGGKAKPSGAINLGNPGHPGTPHAAHPAPGPARGSRSSYGRVR